MYATFDTGSKSINRHILLKYMSTISIQHILSEKTRRAFTECQGLKVKSLWFYDKGTSMLNPAVRNDAGLLWL